MFQLLRRVKEVICVGLWRKFAGVGFLDKVFVSLFLGEVNCILLPLEVDVRTLHEVPGRLPTHQRILPAVTLRENIPIHTPALRSEISGLCCRLGLFVNSATDISLTRMSSERMQHTEQFEPAAP